MVGLREQAKYEGRQHVKAVLALAGSKAGGMGRDEVTELLWPGFGQAAGRNRLYHTVHLARQLLGEMAWEDDWVVVRGGQVQLDTRVSCDVLELQQAWEAMNAGRQGAAVQEHDVVALCSQPWMPQLELGAVGQGTRARIKLQQMELLKGAVQWQWAQGDTPYVRSMLQALLELQETDEWAHRELMKLELQAGKAHAVLRQFEHLGSVLGAQLGLKPQAATCEVAAQAQALLQARQPRAAAVLDRPARLVGRESVLGLLLEQLGQGPGVWNVSGLGGVGKSSVLQELLRRAATLLPAHEGAQVVRLGDQGAQESAASSCVRELGLMASNGQDEYELLACAMRLRPMLLVLDDLDVAADAQRLLQKLLEQPLKAWVITSSRMPLELAGVRQVALQTLEVPQQDAAPAQAMQSAAFALFQQRCTASRLEQQAAGWHRDAVKLVRRLDGLPLAIELAAARTATMMPGEIAQQIERGLGHLAQGPLDMLERQRSLQASLDWSTQLLSAEAQALYRAASVMQGQFEPQQLLGMAAVVGLDSQGQAQQALQELLNAGLLVEAPGKRPGSQQAMLRMLHLPRAHARAQALAQGQWQALLGKRLQQVSLELQRNALHFEDGAYTERLQRVGALQDDALALLEYAKDNERAHFVTMLVTLCEYWATTGALLSILRHAPEAICAAQQLHDVDAELWLRANQLRALRLQTSADEAQRVADLIPDLVARATDHGVAAHAAIRCGIQWSVAGQVERCIRWCHSVIDSRSLTTETEGFWTIYWLIKWFGGAVEPEEFDLASLRPRLEGSGVWPTLLRLNIRHSQLRFDIPTTVILAQELIECSKAQRSPNDIWFARLAAAEIELKRNRLASALEQLSLARKEARDAGSSALVWKALMSLVYVCVRTGPLERAEQLIQEAIETCPSPRVDEHPVALVSARTILLVLQDRVDQAVEELLMLPSRVPYACSDEHLDEFGDACALLAQHAAPPELSRRLAVALRRHSFHDEEIPMICAFRDRHLGAETAAAPGSSPDRRAAAKPLQETAQEFIDYLIALRGERTVQQSFGATQGNAEEAPGDARAPL
jgi:DNA-binding SARP family transcriptional activator